MPTREPQQSTPDMTDANDSRERGVRPVNGTAVRQTTLLLALSGIFAWLLIFATRQLWFGTIDFPTIPLLSIGKQIPTFVQLILALGLLAAASLWISPIAKWRKQASLTFALCGVSLVICDQHRLQPWLCQLIILSVFHCMLPPSQFVRFARLLLISIYVFSAASKFDYLFVQTLGQQFLDTLVAYSGISPDTIPATWRPWLALLFPAGELLTGICLLPTAARRIAGIAGVVLHLLLLAILGPMGLSHSLGVLTWNLMFVGQLMLLFVIWPDSAEASSPVSIQHARTQAGTDQMDADDPTNPSVINRYCGWWATLILLLPLLEPLGLYDHWPAWQLYAPRNSRARMFVLEKVLEQLPQEFGKQLVAEPGSPWIEIDLQNLTLDRRNVPIYPQARYQLGLALAIAQQAELDGAVQVSLLSTSDRLTGKRQSRMLRGSDEINRAAGDFLLNAWP